ncbi:uncharacterized protein LOC143292207 [Babylonia areolata]|uniref:uncharacterized protein LOC143292207 n=1 Tax=Babylonia areolata TaxID=304850 RepID=UPI003FD42E82
MATKMGSTCSFRQILKKLEVRFGARELPETARIWFQQAGQHPEESYKDWANRVLSLATQAFQCLAEAINKFCQGSQDKEAGKYACLKKPSSMEETLNDIKWFKHVSMVMDSKQKEDKELQVNAVSFLKDILNNFLREVMQEIIASMRSSTLHQGESRDQASSLSDTESDMKCFFCKQMGHKKQDCRRYKK